jgi:CheY-like chemotaxis protein
VSQKKILIVDDYADMRLGLGVWLRASKFITVFAADGLSAIAAAQRERPDLILLDLGLPGGDGFLVLQRMGRFRAWPAFP